MRAYETPSFILLDVAITQSDLERRKVVHYGVSTFTNLYALFQSCTWRQRAVDVKRSVL
jgi:hypothetical protein